MNNACPRIAGEEFAKAMGISTKQFPPKLIGDYMRRAFKFIPINWIATEMESCLCGGADALFAAYVADPDGIEEGESESVIVGVFQHTSGGSAIVHANPDHVRHFVNQLTTIVRSYEQVRTDSVSVTTGPFADLLKEMLGEAEPASLVVIQRPAVSRRRKPAPTTASLDDPEDDDDDPQVSVSVGG